MLASYETVPDVEQPDDDDGIPSSDVIIAKAQERYPEAGTKFEAEFLGRLDDAIDNAEPNVTIPRVSANDLQPSADIEELGELIKSLKVPTAALAVTIATALILIVADSRTAQAIYPYYACILTFMSSIPDIRKRVMAAATPVFGHLSATKENVEKRVEGVSTKGLRYLSITEAAMKQAIAPIKEKVAFATKAQDMLRTIDPTIDIPDTTDIEEEFDGFEGQMKTAFSGMQHIVDLSHTLPEPLKSLEKFQIYLLVPFLAVMLGLQLWGVYTTSLRASEEEVKDATLGTSRWLVENGIIGQADITDSAASNYTSISSTNSATIATGPELVAQTVVSDDGTDDNEWLDIWIAIQTYVTTVLQIVLAFLITQVKAMVYLMNFQIGILESRVNKELRQAVGGVFETVFKKGFSAVKKKFLDLVRKIDKIESHINQMKSKIPGEVNIPGNHVLNIPTNIPSPGGFLGKFGRK